MFRLFLVALLGCSLAVSAQDLKPTAAGLVGEYFKGKAKDDSRPKGKPFFVRVDKQVNFKEVSGDFYGSKLDDGFSVRWTGTLQVPADGTYSFTLGSDDGSRLYIDDKLVVDHWGDHSFSKKSGTVDLSAGEHKVLIVYYEGGGGAACQLWWTPPGGKEAIVPADAFSHELELAAVDWDQKAWKKAKVSKGKGGGGAAFDAKKYGPFLGAPVRIEGANEAFRGIVLRLNEGGDACVVFDGDTMRMAAGWLDGGLKLHGLPFSGGHGAFPELTSSKVFINRAAPGWASPAGSLEEPRPGEYPPLGPLPKDWAHYKGLYLNGDVVVLHYTVGGAKVLEQVTLESVGEQHAIVLNFDISGGSALTLVVAEADDAKVDGAGAQFGNTTVRAKGVDGASFEAADGQVLMRLPANASSFKLFLVAGDDAAADAIVGASAAPASLAKHTTGGPARWGDPITTKGELGPDDAAYTIDRLTVPYDNPFGSQMRIGGMDFFSDPTKAAVSTWSGDVWIVSGIDDTLENLQWKRFATGGHEPLGLKIVDDVIYTVADDQITRYHDLNNDGEADYYENFNNDWDLTSGFHAFCFDLHTDPEGNFYFAFGAPVKGGGRSFMRVGRHHGSVLKVSKDGSTMTRYASGFRAPNGMGVSPTGQVTTGDNEGTFVPRCPINWVDEGSFHGVIDTAENRDQYKTTPTVEALAGGREKHLDKSEEPKPLAWLPKSVDNSGGGQVWVTSDKWGPFKGELLHMSYGQSSLYLVMKEDADGQMQGGVVKFPVKFTSSAMRARFNARDGQLYVTGLKGWQTNAARAGGFDRVRYTGKPVAMPNSLKVVPGGLEIGFSAALDPELANDVESFSVNGKAIQWTHNYGTGETPVPFTLTSAKLQENGRTVFLAIEDMKPVHMMEVSIDLETADGEEIITKIWNTVHVVPTN
jgi:hypothetical protein